MHGIFIFDFRFAIFDWACGINGAWSAKTPAKQCRITKSEWRIKPESPMSNDNPAGPERAAPFAIWASSLIRYSGFGIRS